MFFTFQLTAQQTVGLFLNDDQAFNGYTLFSPLAYQHTYLIDNCGFKVNEWQSEHKPALSAYLLESGHLLRTAFIGSNTFSGSGSGGRLQIYDWEGSLTWQYDYSADEVHHQHHDIEPLPNGNILVVAWEYKTPEEAIAAGRNPDFLGASFHPDKIAEIRPIGSDSAETVWEWHVFDHLIQDFDLTKANYGTVADHPELIDINYFPSTGADWMHANSVAYNPDLDQIVLNVRNFGEFWVIDHSTTTAEAASHTGGNSGRGGDLLYRWGNPQTYQRGTPDDRQLTAQHDAHWIPAGELDAGKIMIFNNENGTPNHSAILVINPPLESDGTYSISENMPYTPALPDWTYTATPLQDFYADFISGAQRLPNGNTLICEGVNGRFFEVDINGEMYWEYISPVSFAGPLPQNASSSFDNQVFRAYRYAPDYPAFTGRDLTPSVPIELNPSPSDCELYVPIDVIPELTDLVMYPNPMSAHLNINKTDQQALRIAICDLTGRTLYEQEHEDDFIQIDVRHFQSGIYFINFYNKNNLQIKVEKMVKM